MKIAIIGSRGFPSTYGGYETLVRHLARTWSGSGHDVTVYCRDRPEGRRSGRIENVRCIWTPGYDSKSASTLSFGLTSVLDAVTRNFDAALVLNIANGFFLPFLRLRGLPTVVNTDGVEWCRGKWGRFARRVFYKGAELSAHFADVLVCDSREIGRLWKEEFGVASQYIPYGGEIPAAIPAERVTALGLCPKSFVLCVARLIPENNVNLTLDALALLEAPAVIVGTANYGAPIERRLRTLDQRGKIRWLGHVSDQQLLQQLWAHCGVYVHGHSVGGTNPALIQALGFGAPTLALDTPFNREVLQRDSQLYARDPATLAARVKTVLTEPELQGAMAAWGQQLVAERYSWRSVCRDYERALETAIELRRRVGS